MLMPYQFIERWQAEVVAKSAFPDTYELVTISAHRFIGFPLLPETARRFLTEAGLPQSCRPCLIFDDLTQGLRHLWEVFSPGQWKHEERRGIEHYGMIGSDGAGNPICVDERDGRVVLLDHELLFEPEYQERRVTFVNSSVAQLAESLLFVNTFRSSAQLEAIKQIDEAAVAKGAFWSYEAIQAKPWWKIW